MFESISRSWELTKLSFNVIRADKELILFPLAAGIFSVLFIISMVFPTVVGVLLSGGKQQAAVGLVGYGLLFIIYLGLSFIATFFNVCVVYTARKRFDGGNATFSESLGFAFSKLHLIFSWSLVSATVGVILRLIDNLSERGGLIGELMGRIVTSILGLVWSLITIFVVPAMVYDNLGPLDAIKKSVETLKRTWGESIVRYYGLGIAEAIFIVAGVAAGIFLLLLGAAIHPAVVIVFAILLGIYFLGVILLFTVANSIFNTALYVYAGTGKIPTGYNKEILAGALGPGGRTSEGIVRPGAGLGGGFA